MKLSTPLLLLSATVLGALAQDSTTSSTLSIRSHVLPSGGPYTKSSGSYTLPTTTGSQTTPLPTSTTSTTITTSTTPTIVPTTLSTTSTTTSPLPSSTLSTTSMGSRTSSSSSSTSATTSSKPSSGALSMRGLEGGNYVLATLLSSLLFFL